jgi:diguanylate cyclase (GGDEF)-like protein
MFAIILLALHRYLTTSSLVTQIYTELIDKIDSQDKTTKEEVVKYLCNASNIIANIKDDEIDSVEHAKLASKNTYKDIAEKSILSYKYTNNKFETITQMHQDTINECKDTYIDLPFITEKLNEIQSHMSKEVERTNNVIAQLTQQIKALEESSNLDSLTRVFNRRALNTYLKNICNKKSIKDELHLLILDIDDFKVINDTYGHIAGDKILIFVSNMLRKTLRDGDKIFRYGGEEFIIILNRINTQKCLDIANRILKLISTNKLIYKGDSINVTVSIGATKYCVGDTPESLINRADKALYNSKNSGKNQINSEVNNGI